MDHRRSPAHLARLLLTGIALLAVLLTVWAQWWGGDGALADHWLRDRIIQWRAVSTPEPRVLIVDIDEESLRRLGPWPWPRSRLADLTERLLADYQAKGVALDIVLPDPPRAGDSDERLALLAAHGPVLLSTAFDFNTVREYRVRQGALGRGLPAADYPQAVPASGYIGNDATLARAARIGNVGFIPDPDGVFRRLPLYVRYGDQVYPALTVALLSCCSGHPLPALGHDAFLRLEHRRDWSALTVVSAADILSGAIDPASASDRLVVVGSSNLGLADRVATPHDPLRPGLGVHGVALSQLLDMQAGTAPAPWPGRLLALLYTILCAALLLFALPRLPALASVALLVAASALWCALAVLIVPHDPQLIATSPLASNLFLLAVAVPVQWQLTQQRSRHLLSTLRQYVARQVVDELLRSDLQDPLAPASREITTLIADLEGYSSHVEAMPVEEAGRLTRDFLDCLTGPVLEHQGTLDKYTGDGLVAFWGAPLPIAEHADLALDAAREILARVAALNRVRAAAGARPLRVRIGIESGPAMAGDFGSRFRAIYTAVGDSVNTASRLEQAARDYPYDVIIGAGTAQRARRHALRMLEERKLRGKENPTTLFVFADPAPPAMPVSPELNS